MLIIARQILVMMLFPPEVFFVHSESLCTCGVSESSGLDICDPVFNVKVIGGREAEINEFPWTALLEIRTAAGGSRRKPFQRCGGTLVNDRFLIPNICSMSCS